jgi:hypothetical protein
VADGGHCSGPQQHACSSASTCSAVHVARLAAFGYIVQLSPVAAVRWPLRSISAAVLWFISMRLDQPLLDFDRCPQPGTAAGRHNGFIPDDTSAGTRISIFASTSIVRDTWIGSNPMMNRTNSLELLLSASETDPQQNTKGAHAARKNLKRLFAVGRLQGMGPGSSLYVRWLMSILHCIGALMMAYLNVRSYGASLHDERNSILGVLVSCAYIYMFLGHGVACRFSHTAMQNHIVTLMAGLDWSASTTKSLRVWMAVGFWGWACITSGCILQGFFFVSWLQTQYENDPREAFLWVYFYFFYGPIVFNQMAWGGVMVIVANHATTAQLAQSLHVHTKEFAYDKVGQTSAAAVEKCLATTDSIMDTLVRINTIVIPADVNGFGKVFALFYTAMVAFGVCMFLQYFKANTRASEDGSMSSEDAASQSFSTLFASGLCLVMAQVVALVPAQVSTKCKQVRYIIRSPSGTQWIF